MRALARTPFVAAVTGGAVVAVALLALGVGGSTRTTTTMIQQAALGGGSGRGDGDGPASALTANDVYERDAPGVVFVRAKASAHAASPFGQPQVQQREATGTGFVIDADGHLLTNYHVVGTARTVRVEFSDERVLTARVLGHDATNDLALLKVDPDATELHPLTLGDSSSARVGDPVVAIGNPFGLERTLTTGVVSALQRQLQAPNGFAIQHVIQTDAPLNPGNSGGPLIDASGRVIGINSQIAASASGSAGIGFAVPINTAKRQLAQLQQSGSVAHPYLGITGLTIDDRLAELQLRVDRGVLVQSVHAGGPAARAGLRGGRVESQLDGMPLQLGGDVIASLDGVTLRSMEQLSGAVADLRPGSRVRLGILRDGESIQVTVTIGTAPASVPDEAAGETP